MMGSNQPVENAAEATTGPTEGEVKRERHDGHTRARLRDVEAERDQLREQVDALRGRVDAMVTGEVARLLRGQVRDPAAALKLTDKTPADFLGRDGAVDVEKLSEFATDFLREHPHYERMPVATGDTQHRVTVDQMIGQRPRANWHDLLSGGGPAE